MVHDQLWSDYIIMQPNSNYQEQNNVLAQLHRLRQERLNPNPTPPSIRIEQKQEKWELQKETQSPKLYLAPLIYDGRSQKPYHYVPMHRLFNQDVRGKSMGFDTKKKIKSIFMTTFGFETEVLEPIAEIGCNLVVVNQFKGVAWVWKENYAGHSNWTVVRPVEKKGGWGVFHTKLWLIKFETFLRVVISTGNLHLGDWSVWGNAYWYQDFQLKKQQAEGSKSTVLKNDSDAFDKNQDFCRTLKICVSAMLPSSFPKDKLDIDLQDYSFENIDVVLIPSIPGTYSEQSYGNQGIGKVRRVIKHYMKKGQIKLQDPVLTANTTSVGEMSPDFLEQVYSSFTNNHKFSLSKTRVVYPSTHYVNNQTLVPPDPLFFSKAKYQKFPQSKAVFCKLDSNPLNPIKGFMPHLKTIIVDDQGNDVILYIGSHNLTKGAWGNMSKNNKLTISNSELGVLFLHFDREYLKKWLPFKYPPEKYGPSQTPYTSSN